MSGHSKWPHQVRKARKTRRARNCSPSSSARWRWPPRGGRPHATPACAPCTRRRVTPRCPRHIERAIKRGTGELDGCATRLSTTRLRPRWGRRHRRDPDRQPQPHGSEIRNLFNRNADRWRAGASAAVRAKGRPHLPKKFDEDAITEAAVERSEDLSDEVTLAAHVRAERPAHGARRLDAVGLEPESADSPRRDSTVEVADEARRRTCCDSSRPSTTTTTSKPCTPITTSRRGARVLRGLNRPPA